MTVLRIAPMQIGMSGEAPAENVCGSTDPICPRARLRAERGTDVTKWTSMSQRMPTVNRLEALHGS